MPNRESAPGHPLAAVFEWMSEIDFAVLDQRFAPHGRDYQILVQDRLGADPGTHELTFTHCVEMIYETRVADSAWQLSWGDDLTDYQRWQKVGEPEGYVWGTNWSNAYPGLAAISGSERAVEWTARLGKEMHEAQLETDRFALRLVFHTVRSRKISESVSTISQVHIPIEW